MTELPSEVSGRTEEPDDADRVDSYRLAKLEGRIKTLESRLDDVLALERARKQRAVYYRLLLLVLLLAGFFVLRLRQGATP